MGYPLNPDVSFLGYKDQLDGASVIDFPQSACICGSTTFFSVSQAKSADELGCEITYRCVNCRTCKDCRDGDQTEAISIREEVEDNLLRKSYLLR